jgi:hypothetical protein
MSPSALVMGWFPSSERSIAAKRRKPSPTRSSARNKDHFASGPRWASVFGHGPHSCEVTEAHHAADPAHGVELPLDEMGRRGREAFERLYDRPIATAKYRELLEHVVAEARSGS